jgi:hypothetical protein
MYHPHGYEVCMRGRNSCASRVNEKNGERSSTIFVIKRKTVRYITKRKTVMSLKRLCHFFMPPLPMKKKRLTLPLFLKI